MGIARDNRGPLRLCLAAIPCVIFQDFVVWAASYLQPRIYGAEEMYRFTHRGKIIARDRKGGS